MIIAMAIAGLINIAMLVMAASVFYKSRLTNVDSLEGAHRTLEPILGGASSTLFALALLASGLSSSTVGHARPARSSCRASSIGRSRSACAGW